MLRPRNWLTRSRLSSQQLFDKNDDGKLEYFFHGCNCVITNFEHALYRVLKSVVTSYKPPSPQICCIIYILINFWKGCCSSCCFPKQFRNVWSSEHVWSGARVAWVPSLLTLIKLNVSNQETEVVIYCTSLHVCFLLSEKSMRQKPPPRARAIFRGSRHW